MSQALVQHLQTEAVDEHDNGRGDVARQPPGSRVGTRLRVGRHCGQVDIAQDQPRADDGGAQDLA